jgi:hypothetical protein
LTTSGDVTSCYISSDGELVAFFRNIAGTGYQLDVVNYDGTNLRTLLSASTIASLPRSEYSIGLEPGQAAWISGTHTLGLNFKMQFEGPGSAYTDTLYLVNGDAASYSTIPTYTESWKFSFSPDGTRLLLSDAQSVDLYDSTGSLIAADVITYEFVNTASEFAWVAEPTWKADSSAFAAGILPTQPWGDDAGASVVYAATNMGAPLPASIYTVMKYNGSNPNVTFDPGLTHAAYAVPIGPLVDNNYALHINTLDGMSDTIIHIGAINDLPVWSPDGGHYIFSVGLPPTEQVFLGSFTGDPLLLPAVTWLNQLEWIDNSRFVVSTHSGGYDSLLLGDTMGSFSVIYNDPDPTDVASLEFDVN